LRKDSNDASEQLVGCKAGNLWQYEPFIDDLTGHIVGAEYNAQKTLSIVPVMVMACVKPIAINYAIFLNPIATNAVNVTAQAGTVIPGNNRRKDTGGAEGIVLQEGGDIGRCGGSGEMVAV